MLLLLCTAACRSALPLGAAVEFRDSTRELRGTESKQQVEVDSKIVELSEKSKWTSTFRPGSIPATEYVGRLKEEREQLEPTVSALTKLKTAAEDVRWPSEERVSETELEPIFELLWEHASIFSACLFGQVKRREIEIPSQTKDFEKRWDTYQVREDEDSDVFVSKGKKSIPLVWSPRARGVRETGEDMKAAASLVARAFVEGSLQGFYFIRGSIELCTKDEQDLASLLQSIEAELHRQSFVEVSVFVVNRTARPVGVLPVAELLHPAGGGGMARLVVPSESAPSGLPFSSERGADSPKQVTVMPPRGAVSLTFLSNSTVSTLFDGASLEQLKSDLTLELAILQTNGSGDRIVRRYLRVSQVFSTSEVQQ